MICKKILNVFQTVILVLFAGTLFLPAVSFAATSLNDQIDLQVNKELIKEGLIDAKTADSAIVPQSDQKVIFKPILIDPRNLKQINNGNQQNGFRWPNISWEFVAVVISIIAGLTTILGFSFNGHKRKRAISKYMEEIDSTFAEFKWKSKRCEAELYRLHDVLEDRLKKGKIDEPQFELLDKRIDKYILAINEKDK
jgi:hypothetical protein